MEESDINLETTKAISVSRRWLHSKYASAFLASLAFAESVFLPIVTDPFLVAFILAKTKKWRRYTILTIFFSVLGGAFGYLLGALFFDTLGVRILDFYSLHDVFARISNSLNQDGFVFVLIGALTPVPYKLVAIASGVLHLNIVTFMVASVVGRGLRLGLVGLASYYVGPTALATVRRNLRQISILIGIVLIAYLIVRLWL